MPVSQMETALSRGRLPSYLCRRVHDLILMLLSQRGRRGCMMTRMSILYLMRLLSPQLICQFHIRNSQPSSSLLLNSLFNAVYHHYYSFDMNIRPTILFGDPPMVNPVEELLPLFNSLAFGQDSLKK
jgi:hypothetical protein